MLTLHERGSEESRDEGVLRQTSPKRAERILWLGAHESKSMPTYPNEVGDLGVRDGRRPWRELARVATLLAAFDLTSSFQAEICLGTWSVVDDRHPRRT